MVLPEKILSDGNTVTVSLESVDHCLSGFNQKLSTKTFQPIKCVNVIDSDCHSMISGRAHARPLTVIESH